MIKKVALIVCAMVLSLVGLISLCLFTGVFVVGNLINIFLVFPLSMFYIYACYASYSVWHGKRYLIGSAIVMANIFPVLATYGARGDAIYLVRDFFGSKIVMYEDQMPWHMFSLNEPKSYLVLFFLVIGFALIELGGWCFRKAHAGSPSPKARVAVKAITLLLVNAMNLTMLATLAGLISKGDTPWSYGAFGLSFLAIGTLLLALFIWFRPTWRWWIAMLPSIVIFYVMPFWLTTYLNDRGEIESPWNKADDRGTIEAPRRSP